MTILECVLSNVAIAAMLALVAAMITRMTQRPQVAHVLWLLVLVKLVTPPIIHIPLALPVAEVTGLPASPDGTSHGLSSPTASGNDGFEPFAVSGKQTVMQSTSPFPAADSQPRDSGKLPSVSSPASIATRVLVGVWIAGSAGWYVLACRRLCRFRQLLRYSSPASEQLLAEVTGIADRYGIRHIPQVRVVNAALPPLLGSFGGRSTMVLPHGLLCTLGDDERVTLLAHELAHLKRRDHWTRWFEFLVLGIYWWNPVAWWARAEVQQAEEECCDAWVLWLFPGHAPLYAQTLMNTVEFSSRSTAPVLHVVTAFTRGHSLTRRIELIISERVPHRLSWPTRITLLLFCLTVVPVSLFGSQVRNGEGGVRTDDGVLDATAQGHLVTVIGDGRLTHWDRVRWIVCPDEHTIVSYGSDGALLVWNRNDGSLRRGFYDVIAGAYASDADLCFMVTSEGTLEAWSRNDDRTISRQFAFPKSDHAVLACSPCGRLLALATGRSTGGEVTIWDYETESRLFSLPQHVTGMSFSPDSKSVVFLEFPCTISVYDTSTWTLLGRTVLPPTEQGHGAAVYAAAFSDTGERVYVGNATGRLYAFEWNDEPLVREIASVPSTINDLSVLTRGTWAALVVASNSDCRIIDITTSPPDRVWSSVLLNEAATAVWHGPSGTVVAVRGGRLVEMGGGAPRRLVGGPRNDATCFAFSPRGDRIALAGRDGQIMIRDTSDWECVRSWRAHDGWVQRLAWSPRGDLLLSKADDQVLAAWDPNTGFERHSFRQFSTFTLNTITFDRTGEHFAGACGGSDFAIDVIDADSFEVVHSLPNESLRVRGNCLLSHDARRLFAGGWQVEANVWSIDDRRVVASVGGPTKDDVKLALSPREDVLFSAQGKSVSAFDMVNFAMLWSRAVHDPLVTDISLHPVLPVLATAGTDGVVSIVDTANGEVIKRLRVAPARGKITQVDFSPDGQLLAVGMINGTVAVLRSPWE